jgi:hypothetical protein
VEIGDQINRFIKKIKEAPMGGLGSGNRRGERKIRPIVEEHLSIKILEQKKKGLLEPDTAFEINFSGQSHDHKEVSVLTTEDSIIILHRHLSAARRQEVKHTRTKCFYGGSRPWFICGRCNSKRNTIYLGSEGFWACRECLGLAYQVQRLNTHERHAYMAAKLQKKKLGIPSDKPYLVTERPFRMWTSTYIKILDQIIVHHRQSHEHFKNWFYETLSKAQNKNATN